MTTYHAKLVGTGSYLPQRVVTNDDLAKTIDTSDEWIYTRSGIRQRHIISGDETVVTMACAAVEEAIERSGIDRNTIDLLLVATSTPLKYMPSTACLVQAQLGLPAMPAYDINAACSGFMYGLKAVSQWMASGDIKTIVLVGVDAMSQIIDWQDRSTCVLFGDGAGAAIFQRDTKPGLLSVELGGDAQYADLLATQGTGVNNQQPSYLKMAGSTVFKKAVKVLASEVHCTLARNHMHFDQIDWLVPHQANIRIIQATAKALKLPMSQVILTIEDTANTTAASIPIALHSAMASGQIKMGQTLLLEAFGAGFTWGSGLLIV